jgi:hypothetical protein
MTPKTEWELGTRDAVRMIQNGYAPQSLRLTCEDVLSRHPHDEYWKGIHHVLNTEFATKSV